MSPERHLHSISRVSSELYSKQRFRARIWSRNYIQLRCKRMLVAARRCRWWPRTCTNRGRRNEWNWWLKRHLFWAERATRAKGWIGRRGFRGTRWRWCCRADRAPRTAAPLSRPRVASRFAAARWSPRHLAAQNNTISETSLIQFWDKLENVRNLITISLPMMSRKTKSSSSNKRGPSQGCRQVE